MKFSICNIALPEFEHQAELGQLSALGLSGLEVAPSRVWQNIREGLTSRDVSRYRSQIETAGLQAVGLHSLFWDQPELGLFRGEDATRRTIDFLVHLSGVCRDLGGRTLIFGSAPARKRGSISAEDAKAETLRFFEDLCPKIEHHGTCICFEPLAPRDGDFVNSALESWDIVSALNHPSIQVQLDAKALVANEEADLETFEAVQSALVHFHANEPDMGVLGSSGQIDHRSMAEFLRSVGYKGFVSIEQRLLDPQNPMAAIQKSTNVLRELYS